MSKKKVLLLRSGYVDLSSLNSSPRYRKYEFSLFDALRYLEDSSIQETSYYFNLENKVKEINPKFLVAHAGMAFERYPYVFSRDLLILKRNYPEIRIGIDRKHYFLSILRENLNLLPNVTELLYAFESEDLLEESEELYYICGCLR